MVVHKCTQTLLMSSTYRCLRSTAKLPSPHFNASIAYPEQILLRPESLTWLIIRLCLTAALILFTLRKMSFQCKRNSMITQHLLKKKFFFRKKKKLFRGPFYQHCYNLCKSARHIIFNLETNAFSVYFQWIFLHLQCM